MGAKAELLARVDGWDDSVVYTTDSGLGTRQAEAEDTLSQLRRAAPDLGLYGASADAAYERFWELSSRVAAVSTRIDGLRAAGMAALNAVKSAQEGYVTLPSTALTPQDRASIRQQCRPDMFGQTISNVTAELQLTQQKEAAREAAAAKVLNELSAEISGIKVPGAEYYDPATDPNAQTGTAPRSSGGGGQYTRSAGGYSAGGGYSTSGAAYTVGVAAAAPALITTFPGTNGGSSSGVIGGGSSSGSKGGSGTSSGTKPGTVYTPGHGDGSSSDGSTVGTLPGGGTTGGGGGWGGSSSGGSTLGGVGAGGLAGGLMVGGAALGAGKLGGAARAGAGMLGGVGGLGAAGGIGGGSGSIGGTGGAGATSMIGGTTSSLAQGSQAGAGSAGASGSRAGTTGGMPMGGGSGGGGGQSKDKRRGSMGLLAPDLGVAEDGPVHDLGAGARAGGRDSLPTTAPADEIDEDTW
jgi:hypothetical protein